MASERCLLVEIDEEGKASFVWSDSLVELADAGQTLIERASYVEPDGRFWSVDLSPIGGPFQTGFLLRGSAIDFELDWIRENRGL